MKLANPGEALRFALPALLAFAFTALTPKVLGDGDSWWHVRAGEWMLDHRAVPMTDPFSFTFAGMPWHAHEWLSEVFFALAYRLAGWSGVMLLAGLAVGIAIGLLYQWLARHVSTKAAIVAVFLVFACLAPGLLARPHLLAIPLLVAWTRALLDARSEGGAPSLWWLLLIVLWANMHGSVLFAVALIGPFALEALIDKPGDWKTTVRDWGLFGTGALLATFLTPRGPEGVLFLVELTRMESLAHITEWRPPDFTRPSGLELLIVAGLFVLLRSGVKIPPVRLASLLLLLHMTLQHQRHQTLLAIVGAMICCEAIGRMRRLEVPDEAAEAGGSAARPWQLGAAAAAFLGVVVLRLAIPAGVMESATSPATAFAHVPAALHSRPVLNGYDSGGFLIGQGMRPFIDGRTDLYGDAFFARYDAVVNDRPGELERALGDYDIGWTFLPAGSPAAARLDRLPGWRRHYSDEWVTIHIRG